MPSLTAIADWSGPEGRLSLVRCDGHDPRRPQAEVVDRDRLWIILSGRLSFRDRRGRAVVDPTTALRLAAGAPFEISHPDGGGDLCLALRGPVVTALAERDAPAAGPVRLSLDAFRRFAALAARLAARQPVDLLAVDEAVCAAFDGAPPAQATASGRRDRDVAEAILHALHARAGDATPLAALAAAAGVSVFQACRAFRRVHGTSIHQHKKALRLRHALAYLFDTSWPLARVALECGYASQAHMTSDFSRALGTTPRRARLAGAAGLRLRG